MFLYWNNLQSHECKCSHSELFTLFFSKEKIKMKSKAKSIKIEKGLHVPGGCPRPQAMQEVSLSSVKLSPFMLVILACYPFLFHKVVCKIISISVVFSHSLQCNNCCIFLH